MPNQVPYTPMGQAIPSFDSKREFPTPIVSSSTPFDDCIIVERISRKLENYTPIPVGTAHPEFASHLLNFQQESDDGEWAFRYYAKDRSGQDTYNASLSYVDEDNASPIYSRDYLIRRSAYSAIAELTADPVDASAFLTHQEMLAEPADNRLKNYVAVRRVYKTLPGPWVVSRKRLRPNVIEQTRKRLVAATTIPGAGGGAVTQTGIQGVSVAEAYQYEISWTDDNGVALGENPIFVTEEIIDEDRVIFKHYVQEVLSTDVAPVLNAAYGTSYIWASDGITSVTVISSGSSYTTVPTVTAALPRGGGVAATLVARMKAMTVTASALGSGYAAGDVITLAGGTSTQAAVITLSGLKLSTLAINAAGTGYFVGDTITLAGGTFITAGVVTVSTVKVITATSQGVGTHYFVGQSVTLNGGTSTTAGVLTVDTLLISSISVDAPGTGFGATETITLSGGTFSVQAQIVISRVQLVAQSGGIAGTGWHTGDTCVFTGNVGYIHSPATFEVASTLYVDNTSFAGGTGYLVNDVLTAVEGTFSTPLSIEVDTVGGGGEVLTYTVLTAGEYTVEPEDLTFTGGSGSGFEITGALFGIFTLDIVSGGDYSDPTPDASGNVAATTGTGTGASIASLEWGVKTVAFANGTNRGTYTVLPLSMGISSTSGGGSDATFDVSSGVRGNTITTAGNYSVSPATLNDSEPFGASEVFNISYGILTFAITTVGEYTVTSASFTQGSTSGTGTGATFQSATFTVGGATVTTPGNYSALPSNPVGQAAPPVSGGTGATWTIGWGVLSVTVTNGGSGYTSPNPSVTFSPSGATATAIADAASWRSATAYIIGGKLAEKQDSSNKIKTWTTSPVPPDKVRYISMGYEFPGTITVNSNSQFIGSRPSPGVNYTGYRAHKKATFPARETTTYQRGAFSPADIPEVFALITPAAGSAFFPIGPNFVHNGFTFSQIQTDGTLVYTETFPASSPSYAVGDEVTAAADSKVWRGDMWALRVVVISETAPASLTPPAWSKGADSGATS